MTATFESKVLRTALERALMFAAPGDSRPVLCGVQAVFRGKQAHITGADGPALGSALIRPVDGEETGVILLHRDAVARVLKWLPKTLERVTLDLDGQTVTLILASGGAISEEGMDGQYPHLSGLIETKQPTDHRAMLDGAQIERAGKAVMVGHRKTEKVPTRWVTHDPTKPTVCIVEKEEFVIAIAPMAANWESFDFGAEALRIMGLDGDQGSPA